MSSGPSKEQLEMYWQSSRQYFDELAKYYKTNDPEYYNQFIAPYYSNPLYSIGSKKRSGSSAIVIMAVIVFLIIGIAATGIFLFVSMENEPTIRYGPPKIEKKIGKEIDKPGTDTIKTPPVEVNPKKNSDRKKKIERVR